MSIHKATISVSIEGARQLRMLFCLNNTVTYGIALAYLMYKRKKRSERRKHCALAVGSKAEPKIFALPQTHFPGAWDGQNLISWRWSLPLLTKPSLVRIDACISSYRGNRPTHTNTCRPPACCKDTRQDR